MTEFGVAVCGKRTLLQLYMLTGNHKACVIGERAPSKMESMIRALGNFGFGRTDESHEIKFHYYMINNLCHSYSTRLVIFNIIFYSEQANIKKAHNM